MKDEGAWAYGYGGDWRRRGEGGQGRKIKIARILLEAFLERMG